MIGFFALESALFEILVVPRQAWIYPRWLDQVQYLREGYLAYEYRLDHGFLAAAGRALVNDSPQGSLHPLWALLAFSVFGPSRAAALSINLLAFLALQAATFAAVWKLSSRKGVAWISVGVLVALLCPWSGGPGSATDFRLDWMAACAYGLALAVAVAGDALRSTRWALVLGLAVATVPLTRTLTAAYLLPVFLVLLVAMAISPGRRPGCARLGLAALAAFAVAGPFLWLKREAIRTYYWTGHVAGPERALRDSHMNATQSVQFVVSDLVRMKIGLGALALGLAALVVLILLRRFPLLRAEGRDDRGPALGAPWVVALVSLLVPAAVLCLLPVKASEPVSILIVPALWLLLLSCLSLARRLRPGPVRIAGAAAAAGGMLLFLGRVAHLRPTGTVAADGRTVNALADYVCYRAEECGLKRPRLAVTQISDALGPDVLNVLAYERHHRWIGLEQTLPTGLFETTPAVVEERLRESDFVFLAAAPGTAWPFDRQLGRLLPATSSWCEDHMTPLAEVTVSGIPYRVYERPGLDPFAGTSAVTLRAMLAAPASRLEAIAATPPAAPVFVHAPAVLRPPGVAFSYRISAAYSPVRYTAEGLPGGVELDAATGRLCGRIDRPGAYAARITATNAAGAATREVAFKIGGSGVLTSVGMPPSVRAGVPFTISLGAYDPAARLDFIDITDQTARALITRLPAGEDERRSWSVSCRATLAGAGTHEIALRFVRFDPSAKDPYPYVDEARRVVVEP